MDKNYKANISVNSYLDNELYYLANYPQEMLTLSMCMRAFKLNPDNYKYIPDKYKTLDMVKEILAIDIENIKYVPSKLLTIELCTKIVKKKPEYIKYVPISCMTKEIAMDAFNADYKNIQYIPNEFKTNEMCKKAFEINPLEMWQYIPEYYKNREFCRIIFNLTGDIKLIPIGKRTQEMWNVFFDKDPINNWNKIYPRNKNQKLCDRMFELTHDITLIPEEHQTREMWEYVFKNNNYDFSIIPEKFRTSDMYNNLFEMDYHNIKIIPLNYIKKKMCDIVFSKDSVNMWRFIPDRFKTQEQCNKIFEMTYNISLIPSKFQTEKMWSDVFRMNNCNIDVIPDEFRTPEMISMHKMYSNGKNYQKRLKESEYFELLEINPVLCFKRCEPYLRTRELYEKLIKIDVLTYVKNVPVCYCDDQMVDLVYQELSKLKQKNAKLKINGDSSLIRLVLKKYPKMLGIMNSDFLYDMIINLLISMVQNGGTLEEISKKYNISLYRLNNIIDSLYENDIDKYNLIKTKLKENSELWLLNMEQNCSNFSTIIKLFNVKDNEFLNNEDKVKFSYLYLRYINTSIKVIYEYANRYDNVNWSKDIVEFMNKVFKFDILYGGSFKEEEYFSLKFNNTWLDKFNIYDYFMIKDGKITFDHIYNGHKITVDEAERIINILVSQDIPINNIIVENAFKEYFNGNIYEYIQKIHSYDNEMIVNNRKKN